jgi:hypothetical protein
MTTARNIVYREHHLGEVRVSDSGEPLTAREENVMHARDALPFVMQHWPTDETLAPQAILLLAARVLSAVVRGCDSDA